MRIYVSGKVRGLDDETVRASFSQAERQLLSMGMEVVNPLRLLEDLDDATKSDERKVMMYLLTELARCDAIWMLDNWRQDSHGAACEYHFARSVGMKVMNINVEMFSQLIGKRYRPFGTTEQMVLKTSAELAYEIEEMCAVSAPQLAEWLQEHGYNTSFADGVYTWVLYENDVV